MLKLLQPAGLGRVALQEPHTQDSVALAPNALQDLRHGGRCTHTRTAWGMGLGLGWCNSMSESKLSHGKGEGDLCHVRAALPCAHIATPTTTAMPITTHTHDAHRLRTSITSTRVRLVANEKLACMSV